jgi:2,3-bisphosphoglycerate-dependent phosphoglycerate mutase
MRVDFQRPFSPPEGARHVLLVRHGSVGPPPAVGQVPPTGRQHDPPLDESGRLQAAAVTTRLEQEAIAAVFVTPLRRTIETAIPLLGLLGQEAQRLADLREVELGDWEHGEFSRRAARGDPEFQRVMREQRWDLIPNAEPAAAFARRVRRGLLEAATASKSDSVAVAYTHSGVIAEACRQATGSDPFAFLNSTNCSLTRLVRMPNGRWVLLSFNDTAHLSAEFARRPH